MTTATSLRTAAAMLLAASAIWIAAAPAQAAAVSDTIDGITYSADDADVAAGATVESYLSSGPMGTDPVIPASVAIGGTVYDVTTIDSFAFENEGLTSVVIPNTVTAIGNYAFTVNALTSVTIPNSVTTLGDGAFKHNDLTSVVLPDSITTIPTDAFNDNELTSLTIPNSVTTIGTVAFRYNDLTHVTIPSSVTTLGAGAFSNNALTSVTIPSSLTSISANAFASNDLTSVTIPNSVTTIDDYAFFDNNLSSVTIPNSVTTIENYAFDGNALTSVTIPASVTTIGVKSFDNNPSLSAVTFEGDAPTIIAAGGLGSFSGAAGKTLYFYSGASGFSVPTWEGYNTAQLFEQFTVVFDSTGGSTVADETVTDGDPVAEPADPTRAGYVFTGWYTDAALSALYDFSTAVTGDLTLYAGWEQQSTTPGTPVDSGGDSAGPTDGELPTTGSTVASGTVRAGLLLLAGGLALLILGCRRRSLTSERF